MTNFSKKQKGFTLMEVLVAMALVATISLVVMGALAPWIGMKQKLDTERRLQDIKQGLTAVYEAEAMAIERQAGGLFKEFTASTIDGGTGGCAPQTAGFVAAMGRFSEPADVLAKDGFANPWCIRISNALSESRDGTTLWYRNIAIISTGSNAALDPGTALDASGNLAVAGDDIGILISGRDVQALKLKETLRRLTRVAQTYETYFTARYLANASRDIAVDYFSTAYDTGGSVPSTGGAWTPVSAVLASIGISGADLSSAWESDNAIELGNHSETVGGITVRSPATSGTGALPFTAMLRARLPAPNGQTAYAVQTAIGNY